METIIPGGQIVTESSINSFNKSAKKQSVPEEIHEEEFEQGDNEEEEDPEEDPEEEEQEENIVESGEEGENEQEIDEEEHIAEAQNVATGNYAASVSWKVSDPEILDCPVCCEPLNIPVFQCKNGHIACETCCTGTDKCPYCSSSIGYDRCIAMEKILESVTVKCQNTKYGCKEKMTYSQKHDHEKACLHAPCSCPLSECNFVGTSRKLYSHFRFRHEYAAVQFKYNGIIHISLQVKRKFIVLQEEIYGDIFVLNNRIERHGHIISIRHIAPSCKAGIFYSIMTRSGGSTVRFQSKTKCLQNRVDNPPAMEELLIPSRYFGYYTLLKLDIRIRR